MYQINSLTVAQIRIFRIDELPFSAFQMPSGVSAVRSAFNFQQITPLAPPVVPDPQGGVLFAHGEFSDGKNVAGIPQLQIEPRRITLTVNSTSEMASKAFDFLKGVMAAIDTRVEKPSLDPIFITEETTSTVRFDFSIDRLFEPGPLSMLASGLEAHVSGFGSPVSLTPSAVR